MSAMSVARLRRPGAAFTLVELLVVIGIITILLAVLIPVISRTRRQATIAKETHAIEAFKTGLEAYHTVWNDYPQIAATYTAGMLDADNVNQIHVEDGAKALLTCLGFKLRIRSGSTGYGPFINLGDFSIDTTNHWLVDPNGLPYIYVPATAPPSATTSRFVQSVALATVTNATAPMYNAAVIPLIPNSTTPYLQLADMQVILGDTNNSGAIDSGANPPEQASTTDHYLLWAAGADMTFGFPTYGAYASTKNGGSTTSSFGQTDDITNFPIPVNLKQP